MKSFPRLCLPIIIASILFSSCSKSNEEGKMIPQNATFIAFLNTKSLNEKLSWDEIRQTSWFKHIYSDSATKDWMKKLLDNPENSGIDTKSNLVFFVQKTPGNNYNIVLEGNLKDKKVFEQFNKNLDPASDLKKDGDINLLTLRQQGVVGWDDTHFAYVTNSGSFRSKYAAPWDTLYDQSNMAPAVENSVAISSYCKNLFSLKTDSSLAKNERFANLLSEKGDVHAWINAEEIMKNNEALGMIGMLKLDIFFKNNISTYTINFENGKINVNQVGYAGKEFTEFLKKYKGSSLNTEMIGNIPSQDIIGLLAMNYDPEGLKELLKLTGMDGFINMYAGQMGFNIDDFVKANSGDLLVAFTDLKMTTDSFSYRDNREKNMNPSAYAKPDINYIFSVGIGDNQSFQKLIEAGKKLSNEMGSSDDKLSYNLNDKTFAIGNSQQVINQYLAGHKNKFDFTDKLSGHPIGLFVDIHKILSVLETGIPSAEADAKAIMGESLKIWNNAFFTAGEFKNDGMVANTEVNFVDQSTNSLKQLNHYFDEIAKVMIAKKEREESGSFITPPLVDTIGH